MTGHSSHYDYGFCVMSILSAVEGSLCRVYLLNLLCNLCVPVWCCISFLPQVLGVVIPAGGVFGCIAVEFYLCDGKSDVLGYTVTRWGYFPTFCLLDSLSDGGLFLCAVSLGVYCGLLNLFLLHNLVCGLVLLSLVLGGSTLLVVGVF